MGEWKAGRHVMDHVVPGHLFDVRRRDPFPTRMGIFVSVRYLDPAISVSTRNSAYPFSGKGPLYTVGREAGRRPSLKICGRIGGHR